MVTYRAGLIKELLESGAGLPMTVEAGLGQKVISGNFGDGSIKDREYNWVTISDTITNINYEKDYYKIFGTIKDDVQGVYYIYYNQLLGQSWGLEPLDKISISALVRSDGSVHFSENVLRITINGEAIYSIDDTQMHHLRNLTEQLIKQQTKGKCSEKRKTLSLKNEDAYSTMCVKNCPSEQNFEKGCEHLNKVINSLLEAAVLNTSEVFSSANRKVLTEILKTPEK